MLSEYDLLSEIDKYNAKKNLTPDECIRLAAFYTILNCQYPLEAAEPTQPPMSMANEETIEKTITVDGDSEFFTAIDGRKSSEIWAIMDELMSTLEVLNPRLYGGVMRKINA